MTNPVNSYLDRELTKERVRWCLKTDSPDRWRPLRLACELLALTAGGLTVLWTVWR